MSRTPERGGGQPIRGGWSGVIDYPRRAPSRPPISPHFSMSSASMPSSESAQAYKVRSATAADVAAIVALIDLNVPSGELLPRTPEFVTLHIDHFLVAESEGQVVGCVHLEEYAPSLAEVRSL